jgi:hypothetical protein
MLRAPAAILFLCLVSVPAHGFQISCDEVRAYVAQFGKAQALAFAIKHGATWQEIKIARLCLYAQAK